MGKRGPKAKPTHLRAIEGNPGRLPMNPAEPTPSGAAACPDFLSDDAKAKWREVMESVPPGMITAADGAILVVYCDAWSDFKAATEAMQRGDLLGDRLIRNDRPNPYFRIKSDAAKRMAAAATRLGLSPADRSGLKLGTPQKGNRWSDLIG